MGIGRKKKGYGKKLGRHGKGREEWKKIKHCIPTLFAPYLKSKVGSYNLYDYN